MSYEVIQTPEGKRVVEPTMPRPQQYQYTSEDENGDYFDEEGYAVAMDEYKTHCLTLPRMIPEGFDPPLGELKGEFVKGWQFRHLPNSNEWHECSEEVYEAEALDTRRIVIMPGQEKEWSRLYFTGEHPAIPMPDREGEASQQTLFNLLAEYGGTIESTGKMDEMNIKQARAGGRMWVDRNSLGYVWMPPGVFPETVEEVERFEKWFPLKVELPDSLKTLDWMHRPSNRASTDQVPGKYHPSGPMQQGEAKRLVHYIYEFAWHYGRFYHLGDADKIKAAIAERFSLPEEFLSRYNPRKVDYDNPPKGNVLILTTSKVWYIGDWYRGVWRYPGSTWDGNKRTGLSKDDVTHWLPLPSTDISAAHPSPSQTAEAGLSKWIAEQMEEASKSGQEFPDNKDYWLGKWAALQEVQLHLAAAPSRTEAVEFAEWLHLNKCGVYQSPKGQMWKSAFGEDMATDELYQIFLITKQ